MRIRDRSDGALRDCCAGLEEVGPADERSVVCLLI